MKHISIMLILAFLLGICGCGQVQEDSSSVFYYLQAEPIFENGGSVITAEQRGNLNQGHNLRFLLALYLSGPVTADLRSPFPKGTAINTMTQDGSTLILAMNSAFGTLSAMDLTKAGACLALTVFANSDTETVRIVYTDAVSGISKNLELSHSNLILQDTLTPAQ